jgi:dolichyl-diphosphooligosaccharide--protein glycosyltransferase
MVDARDVADLLAERPDLEPALQAILEPDPPWDFDDVDTDSGAFGELVSHGIVEEHEGGYRVANPGAVRAALEQPDSDEPSPDTDADELTHRIQLPNLRTTAAVVGGLLLVALFRLTSFTNVFRGDDTVLSANDPYYYRYLVEQSLASGEIGLTELPASVTKGEPLFVATLQIISDLAGGTPDATGLVLAWYPVATAVLTGVLLLALVTTLTDDRRVALAALLMFALTPSNAFRTSLGFADHHAFDYLWLTLTALAVTVLSIETTRRDTPRLTRTTAGVSALAAGVAGQTLAWEAGPLLLVPLGVFLALDSLLAVRTGRSPARTHGPTILGIGVGAVVVWTAHTTLEWHTPLVAASPVLLFAGGIAVTAVGEVAYRVNVPAVVPAVVELGGAITALIVFPGQYPEQWERVARNVNTRLLRTDAIAETGGLFGESFGWLLLFGFVFILAVPYLVVFTRRAAERLGWTPLVVYAWYFIVLAVVQIRFAGQMAPFVAVFAGIGFVALAEWVDVIDEPPAVTRDDPDAVRNLTLNTTQSLVVLFLLVGSLSFVQIPIKTSQLTHTDAQYETASWMADHAVDREMQYPDSYVLSQWGDNRFYNYFVNGESRSYGFARSNYEAFLFGTDAQQWYERLRDRTGFVVVPPAAVGNATTIGTRLYQTDGSQTEAAPGLAHYRLVFVSEDAQQKVFTLVPGARIAGKARPNQTLTVETDVTVGSYDTTYEREVQTGANGNYSVTVPHVSEYRVAGESVTPTETDVQNGTRVTVE